MKKIRRFETVPIAEVLKHAVEVDGKKPVEKPSQKTEPYAVPVKGAEASDVD